MNWDTAVLKLLLKRRELLPRRDDTFSAGTVSDISFRSHFWGEISKRAGFTLRLQLFSNLTSGIYEYVCNIIM